MSVWDCLPPLDAQALERLRHYADRLMNAPFNLTAIKDLDGIVVRHFADSLALLPLLPPGPVTLIDVGTGGGFPGLALKIARPELQVTLLDATRKKLTFLEGLAGELGLPVATVHARAEELSRGAAYTGAYDVATARAVAPLPELCALCLPFVKRGGRFFAMKGSHWADELAAARDVLAQFNARWLPPYEYTLPLPDGGARYAVCVAEVNA